jgi:hypothetical protein
MKLRVVRSYAAKPGDPIPASPELSPDDPLLAFASEDSNLPAVRSNNALAVSPPSPAKGISLGQGMVILAAGVALVAVAAGAYQYQQGAARPQAAAAVVPTGRLVLESTPAGAEVTVDGEPRGITPLALDLGAGPHDVAIRRDADVKTLALTITAGSERIHHLEFGVPIAAAAAVGQLTVVTDPPGARVSVDGQARGTSPVTINNLTPTRHRVSVVGQSGAAERTVDVEAGVTTSVVFSLGRAPAASGGWLAVESPFVVDVLQSDDVVGSSAVARIMLPAGPHDFTFVNQELGFRESRRVEIRAGETAAVRLDARATVNMNARPWADVTIDGAPAGQTPIANHSLTLGRHQVVFRHPELGERSQTIVVTAQGPNRVAVDMTR